MQLLFPQVELGRYEVGTPPGADKKGNKYHANIEINGTNKENHNKQNWGPT